MKPILTGRSHHAVSVAITALGTLLGFEALSLALRLYQLQVFAVIALAVYAFHIFWLVFIFDLHLKNRGNLAAARLLNLRGFRLLARALKSRFAHVAAWAYVRHCVNYLILPGLLYWSTVVVMMLNPFRVGVKQPVILFSTAALGFAYLYYKRVFNKRMEHHEDGLKVLNLVKLYAAFLCLSAVFGLAVYFGLDANFLALGLGFVTFLLAYQALFQHDLVRLLTFGFTVALGLLVALAGVILFRVWDTNYFSAGLVLAVVYNFGWGLLHHFLDKNLSRRIVLEYLLMSALMITLILVTHDFRIRLS